MQRLLRPASIAVIGGGTWCENVVKSCRLMGFAGRVMAVHPTRTEIAGVECVASVAELDEAPDACFIGVNRHLTVEIVAQLRALGAGGVVCFASGFAEALAEDEGSADLQAALLEAAGDMPLIGPNCYGFINYLDGALLWPDQQGGERGERGVALIAQSSNIAINLTMQARGLPLAYVVTVGNQAQLGLSQIGAELLRDERVTALGIHIEGIDSLREFEALAGLARDLGKTVVALKVGSSEQAQAATVSHTASLAGSDAGARALFARLGVAQVENLPAFLEALKLAHVVGRLSSARVASLSCSGGEASLMADTGLRFGVEYPALNEVQRDGLRTHLGSMVALANPLDYNTYIWGNAGAMDGAFTAMLSADLGIGLVVIDFPRADRCDPEAWFHVIGCAQRASEAAGVPVGLVASLPENLSEDLAKELIDKGIVPFCGLDDTLAAVAALGGLGEARGVPVAWSREPLDTVLLTEVEAKAELSSFGVLVPKSASGTRREAVGLAESVGWPVVLKGMGLAHKSEAGAVAVGLSDLSAVEAAMAAMPGDAFLVEEMIEGAVAELLVGVVLDPAHGYVLTLAAGGVLTELMEDSVSLMVPSDLDAVREAIGHLKVSRLLAGYRGKPAANMDAVVEAVMGVQAYVMDNVGRVAEVEINPLMCTPERAVAADALIKIGDRDDG